MSVLDGSIANTALPTIARDLHVSPVESIWVVNGVQLAVRGDGALCARCFRARNSAAVVARAAPAVLRAACACAGIATLASALRLRPLVRSPAG